MGKKEDRQKLLSKWSDRISSSKKWREQIEQEQKWETYIDANEGKYDVVLGSTPVPPINEIFAYTQTSVASLFAQNPYISVNAKKTGTIEGSIIWEAALNYHWKELKIKAEVELQIIDGLHVGHGWNKVGNNVKTSGDGDQLHLESETLFSNRVSWRDMFMNVGCRNPPNDNLWMAQRIYRPTEDVKEDYKAAAKLTGSPHPALDDTLRKSLTWKEDINFSALWEIWDARERTIYLMADETLPDFLEEPRPWPEDLKEFPFQMLKFNPIPDKPYPLSDVAPWFPQVLEKIKIFTQALNHIKRWNRQMIAKQGTMNQSELDKFEKGIDGSILFAKTTGDIQTAVKMVDFGTLPPDIYMILDRLDQTIDKIRGQAGFEQGGQAKTQSRTVGELELMKGGSGARTDRKVDCIETHCENIARHLMFNLKQNCDLDQLVKITGNEPQEILQAFAAEGKYDPVSKTIRFNSQDIAGEYDVSIKAGSTLPLDKMSRDQILDRTIQLAIPLASTPSLPPFLTELIKERLRDYDIKGLQVAFDQQGQLMAQQQQQQAQSGQMQDAKVKAETDKRAAQAQQIQTNTEITTLAAHAKAAGVLPLDAKI